MTDETITVPGFGTARLWRFYARRRYDGSYAVYVRNRHARIVTHCQTVYRLYDRFIQARPDDVMIEAVWEGMDPPPVMVVPKEATP